jgi:GT2 family glycosyltransferase
VLTLNPFAVVVLSKNPRNLIACCDAAWTREDTRTPIVIVDDGLEPNEDHRRSFDRWDAERCPIWVKGKKPFCYSVNANIGIRKVPNHDVILLNDDALLKSIGGFSELARAANDRSDLGLISATMNNVGNPNQLPRKIGLRREARMVCFVCVYIPRRTINLIGLLDEDFKCYSHQDDDYCVRVRKAGLGIGIHDGCYVDHGSLQSTFRGPGGTAELQTGARIFKEKWGAENRAV